MASSSRPDPISSLVLQGLGLNLSGILLLAATTSALGPLGWAGTTVAFAIKCIGDAQWIRAYRLWQAQNAIWLATRPMLLPPAASTSVLTLNDLKIEAMPTLSRDV
ncbi:MAG: hypothetical protein OHK0012_02960 [Synechococcales cyanobacterium]